MALSMFTDAQNQDINKMKQEDDRSMSPPINNNQNLFSGLGTMGILPPQLQAAFIRSTFGLFAPYPSFPAWQSPPGCSSPPKSPMTQLPYKKMNNNNNNNLVSTTSDVLAKKAMKRKPFAKKECISVKKDLLSPASDVSMDLMPGLISPPNSGSSPNSTGSIEVPAVASTTRDPSREKVFTCKICNRSFGYKHVLQNHERTHTGEKPFECPECHKRFTRDHHLKTHMRLHTGEKPYSCSHCERQFVQVANLRRHLRVHTGERPYTCDICNSRFSDSNQLKAHSLVHNGEKPFNCERCHARFRRRHHLLTHKCDTLTPTLSPPLFDMKYDMKSELSNESMDLSKTMKQPAYIAPVVRYEDKDAVRKVRIPQIGHVSTLLPEQTEPEDLSIRSPRSPLTIEELEELDDAAALYRKQREKIQKIHGTNE